MNTRNKIIKLIVEAQIYSDAAKRIYDILGYRESLYDSKEYLYLLKSNRIHKAICLCKKKRTTDILFDIHEGLDRHGKICYIVYFTIKNCQYGSKTKQISFHDFDDRLEKFIDPRQHQHWIQNFSRKNSELLLMELINQGIVLDI